MSPKTILSAFEKVTYEAGRLDWVYIYPEDHAKLVELRDKNARQYKAFRKRLMEILGCSDY